MEGSLKLAVEHYKTLCAKHGFKSALRSVETPFIDEASHDPEEDDEDPQGILSIPAASVPM